MRGIQTGLWAALALALLVPAGAQAGPYLGEWGWFWKPAPGCPCGEYSCLHYWAPGIHRAKYCLHPAQIEQVPPGVPVPVGYTLYPQPCRTVPPMPSHPYADPAGYYGRPIIPAEGEAENTANTSDRGPKP